MKELFQMNEELELRFAKKSRVQMMQKMMQMT
jgi:hypothetical protein